MWSNITFIYTVKPKGFCDSLYCDIQFFVVVCNWTCNSSKICLYFDIYCTGDQTIHTACFPIWIIPLPTRPHWWWQYFLKKSVKFEVLYMCNVLVVELAPLFCYRVKTFQTGSSVTYKDLSLWIACLSHKREVCLNRQVNLHLWYQSFLMGLSNLMVVVWISLLLD